MERGCRAWTRKKSKRETEAMTRGYVVVGEVVDGKMTQVFAKHLGAAPKDRLAVWSRATIEKMIRDHIMKPGNNEKTLLDAMSKWYSTELEKGDELRAAWAEACVEKFHVVQEKMFPPKQLDLFGDI